MCDFILAKELEAKLSISTNVNYSDQLYERILYIERELRIYLDKKEYNVENQNSLLVKIRELKRDFYSNQPYNNLNRYEYVRLNQYVTEICKRTFWSVTTIKSLYVQSI